MKAFESLQLKLLQEENLSLKLTIEVIARGEFELKAFESSDAIKYGVMKRNSIKYI